MFLWILAAFCAFFVKGLCGFANTLVFDTILGFGVNNVNISPVELILGYPANITLVYKNRKHINKNIIENDIGTPQTSHHFGLYE